MRRDDLLVFVDPYGLQWEMTTRPYDDPRGMGDGPRLGRWADVSPRRG